LLYPHLVEAVCPLLALAGDGRSVVEGVDDTHRCHAEAPSLPVDRQLQARTCLTPAHVRCERYLAYAARNGPTSRARAAVADGLVSTRLALTPEPAWRGLAGRASRTPRGGLVAAGAGLLIAFLGVGTVTAWALGALPLAGAAASPSPQVIESARPTASPIAPTATASPTRTPTPTRRPTATPAATPVPTATPTATPVPTAAPVQTYVVQEGDTLAAIAQRLGSSVAAIQAANSIDDPNEILIGEVLVIP
jgi:LysM repeat protein